MRLAERALLRSVGQSEGQMMSQPLGPLTRDRHDSAAIGLAVMKIPMTDEMRAALRRYRRAERAKAGKSSTSSHQTALPRQLCDPREEETGLRPDHHAAGEVSGDHRLDGECE